MVIKAFPPVETADEYGLLAVGGDLEPASLLLAYKSGIFPWPSDARTLAWFAPPKRTVLFFKDFHISRSFKQFLKKNRFVCTFDKDFAGVIKGCASAKNRPGQRGTWITPRRLEAYIAFHELGYAHSVECYLDDKLVGGIYGVSIGKAFAAESMFYTKANASKFALVCLVEKLKAQGITWLDAQVMNPFLSKLGFVEIPREKFMDMLCKAVGSS